MGTNTLTIILNLSCRYIAGIYVVGSLSRRYQVGTQYDRYPVLSSEHLTQASGAFATFPSIFYFWKSFCSVVHLEAIERRSFCRTFLAKCQISFIKQNVY